MARRQDGYGDVPDGFASDPEALAYRCIYEQSGIGIFRSDLAGRYIAANPAAVRLHGYDTEAALLRAVGDIAAEVYVDAEDRERLKRRLASEDSVLGFECEIYRHKTGERRWVRQNVWKVFDADGGLLYLEGHVEDITDRKAFEQTLSDRVTVRTAALERANRKLRDEIEARKRIEQALGERETQLQQSQKLEVVGQLTGGIAHDFNNLLGVIVGSLDLLKDLLSDQAQHRSLVDAALRAALRGADLTDRLLAFSRKQVLRPETTDLNGLILGMTELLRRTLGETISIRTVAASDLSYARIDTAQLETALLNLAVNASHAMQGGGDLTFKTANVALEEAGEGDSEGFEPGPYVLLSVSDTGTGIAPEHLGHVFEPFFTTKEIGEGSGLGLSMVQGFVKQSGGHIAIESEEGAGTTVTLYLPPADGPLPQSGAVSEAVGVPRGSGERVLIVAEDRTARNLVAETISGLGYRTREVPDGGEALDVLAEDAEIALLFADVVLSGAVTGADLAEAAQRLRPGLGVLFTSGYTENAAAHTRILQSGCALLTKPYRRETLARRLREALSGA